MRSLPTLFALSLGAAGCEGEANTEEKPHFDPIAEPSDPLRPQALRGEVPAQARITDYQIEARLDAKEHTIEGRARITWRNRTKRSTTKLPLHLYMNAFRADDTAWMNEARGRHRGKRRDSGSWGYVDVKRVAMLAQGAGLDDAKEPRSDVRGTELDWSEDAEPTTMTVQLKTPVGPGEAITIEVEFLTKLPHVFARTGYHKDFHMAGQWFPKLGVLEEEAGWQAHTFSLNGEFYADFGNYKVQLDVPENMVVGASGIRVGEAINHEQKRKTLNYEAHMVHDFAWVADPKFIEHWGEHEGIRIRQLIQPDHVKDAEAHMQAQKDTLDSMQSRFGAYPWSTITIVHVPKGAGGAGGMEYPTLYTTSKIMTSRLKPWLFDERMSGVFTTVHEFGHQYFQGILASNEQAQPWLDEGMNSFSNYLAYIDTYNDPDPWIAKFAGHEMTLGDMSRISVSQSLYDPVDQDASTFRALIPSYGSMVYQKTAGLMMTLRGLVGAKAFDAALKTYALEHRFGHPKGSELEEIFVRELGESVEIVPASEGQRALSLDLRDYFDQALREVSEVDFSIERVTNRQQLEGAGWHRDEASELSLTPSQWDASPPDDDDDADDADEPRERSAADKAKDKKRPRDGTVVVHRRGGFRVPVELLVEFEDGSRETLTWDGQARYHIFTWPDKKVRFALLDPNRKLWLESKRLNNFGLGDKIDKKKAAALETGGLASYLGDLAEASALTSMGVFGP